MLNVIQLQDRLKGLPDSALQTAATMPGEHQIFAMAELSERQRIRAAYQNNQAQSQGTVADRLTAGGQIPEIRNSRPDMGGLAAASNRGDMQPALGMYSGGAVPSPYYMAAAGPVPSAGEKVLVTADALKPPEVKQQKLPADNLFAMITGTGAYKDSGGYFAPMREQFADSLLAYEQGVKDNLQENPYIQMLAAQEQDRMRNEQLAKRDKWLALAQAGLGMASGNSPNFLANVAAGGQAGLAALRQGMTEAEKRQAALQQRTDLLQSASTTIQGNNASALRNVAQQGFAGETAMGRDIFGQGMGAQREEFTREHQSSESALERGFRGAQNAADRASRITLARISEAGANLRAKFAEDYRVAADDRQRDLALQRALADVPNIVSSMIKDGSLPVTEAAAATAAMRNQLYVDAGKTPPSASTARSLPGRNRGEKPSIYTGPNRD